MQLLVYEENHKFASCPEYDLNITKAKIINCDITPYVEQLMLIDSFHWLFP